MYCTIPFGREILFPIINSIFSFVLDPHLRSEDELTRSVTKDIDMVEAQKIVIDKETVNELKNYILSVF
jgi:hypothetical protein